MSFLATIHLTPQQLEERRLAGLALLRKGKTQAFVAKELGVTEGAVSHWVKAERSGGVAALKRRPHTGRPAKIEAEVLQQLPALLVKGAEAYGFEGDVWTSERVAVLIKKKFGVDYHPGHVWKLLDKLGLSWKKPRRRAINRDEKAIQAWVARKWPRLKKEPRSSEP